MKFLKKIFDALGLFGLTAIGVGLVILVIFVPRYLFTTWGIDIAEAIRGEPYGRGQPVGGLGTILAIIGFLLSLLFLGGLLDLLNEDSVLSGWFKKKFRSSSNTTYGTKTTEAPSKVATDEKASKSKVEIVGEVGKKTVNQAASAGKSLFLGWLKLMGIIMIGLILLTILASLQN